MTFDLQIPQPDGTSLSVSVDAGDTLFLLGANGTGKSNLMQLLYTRYSDNGRRISAHRQTWFNADGISLSSQARRTTEGHIRSWDLNPQARWSDSYSAQRPNIALYDLVDAENLRSRLIAGAVDAADIHLAQNLSKQDGPVRVINELLRLSNIPIRISLEQNDRVVAQKANSTRYSIAQLSDGERNALLIAAEVLTAKPGTLILIDEPERHLHRSIISPLLSELFKKRPDCAFVVSTHEVMLPLDNPFARTLLLRECSYLGDDVSAWQADLVGPNAEIPEDFRRDILGGRRRLLFVEGSADSLDKPLYSLVFPDVSVVAKAGCRDVENAVVGIRGTVALHWLHAFGIIDSDRRTQGEINDLKNKGVYALSVFSVESIYYHPEVQRRVAERHASVTGEDASTRLANAKTAALSAVTSNVQRLSERAVEKTVREKILSHVPRQPDIRAGTPVNISLDIQAIVGAERGLLQDSIDKENLGEIIARYPLRETSALTDIARRLGFQNRDQYESAVRKLLIDDRESLDLVRSFFGTLPEDIQTPYSMSAQV